METIYAYLPETMIVKLGWTLIHFLWQGVLLAILSAIVLRLLRRRSSNVRYLTSCIALLLMVVLPVVTIQFIKAEAVVSAPVVFEEPIDIGPVAIAPLEILERPAVTISAKPVAPFEPQIRTASVEPDVPLTERFTAFCEPLLPFIVIGYLLGVFALSIWHLGGWCQLQKLRRVACAIMLQRELLLLVGLQSRCLDLLHLKAEQVELLRVSLFVHNERRLLIFQDSATRNQFTKRRALLFQSTERIKDGELFGGMEKRLMIVRPVHVHEPFADAGENVQRRGRAVDELTIRPRTRERALENELIVLTRLKAVLIDERFQRRRSADLRFGALEFKLQLVRGAR